MRPFGFVTVLALTVISAAGTGCAAKTTSEPRACTLIGCEDGLSVTVRGDRGGDISVRVMAADGQGRSFDCDGDAATCTAFFAEYTPVNVTVTITKREGNAIRSAAVTYRNERPNGEDCPPVCRQGEVDIVL